MLKSVEYENSYIIWGPGSCKLKPMAQQHSFIELCSHLATDAIWADVSYWQKNID